ncbi:probable leucine-rich repeat receptor-like protein kinase IMK3 [Chenopodium quinoa]|uniref:Protein kinase domain-containing protein n=1 Tax=Chenopodium quinoa TaxID=63459 RepID=A0A803M407_CHEQI|nr:probable leucine-rich repeat receptor-like protein kinase IMK3 [Chenopodium quinoa]
MLIETQKKKGKWKIQSKEKTPFGGFDFGFGFKYKVLMLVQLLMILCEQGCSSESGYDGVVITQADYQGLQAFKNELIDPKGYLRSWNDSGIGACSGGWVGIKCAKGQVIVIQLPWKILGGRITQKIVQFQALRKLSLHDNLITGSIPYTLGLLPNLRGVQLFNNRLSGSIPASLGQCPLLQTLDLSHNFLTGKIPPSLANSTKLYWVNLSYNSLQGPIPSELTRSSSLNVLSLQYNNLSGPLPSNLGKLSSIITLDLSHNFIKSSFPKSISRLSSLNTLNLESNYLVGDLPEDIGNLHNLSMLNLRRNRIEGRIPQSIGNLSTLNQLDLSFNDFSGEIPNSLSNLENLGFLNVSYNSLSGSVPTELSEKFNSSSFIGNLRLCGFSPSSPCPSEAPSPSIGISAEAKKARKLSIKDIILIAAGILLVIMLTLCCILLFCLIRKRSVSGQEKEGGVAAAGRASQAEKGGPSGGPEVETGETGGKLVHFDGPMVFTADDLLCATAEIMGKSTYGTVYKATLEDGSQVAVKRLREKITKGQKEFEAEVNMIGKIRHPNLLALRAYYLGPKGEKLLVFDYIPKGSLANFLHVREPDTRVHWPTRMRMIQGMARGLFHLHNNENIIHGNLTSSNVLIDDSISAQISDYGLSRLMTASAAANVIATAGALGYRAPELSKLKKANTKTDVYSLGVIILELLTGKSPGEALNGVDLPQWVASIVKEEWTNEVFDLELMKDASTIGDELLNTLKLGLHCVDPSPASRPEVQQVLQQLEEIRPTDTATTSGDDGGGDPSASD